MARRTPWQHLIVAAHDRPLVTVGGEECRLLGCTPYSGRAKVLKAGRHYIVPAAAVTLIPSTTPTPEQEPTS